MARVAAIGSFRKGKKFVRKAIKKVPAYMKFLSKEGKTGNEPFHDLPLTTKKNYLTQFPYKELMGSSVEDNWCFFTSAGSSGKKAFLWPYSKEQADEIDSVALIKRLLSLGDKSLLIINGLALGSWAGGDLFSYNSKNGALKVNFPCAVVSPGSNLKEIISLLSSLEEYFDEVLLISNPTIVSSIMTIADQENISLPLKKMKFVLTEEGMSENFRIALAKKSGLPETIPQVFSVYASSDTYVLGVEASTNIALRKLCYYNRDFSKHIGIEADLPQFYHLVNQRNVYIESIGDEMVVTKWQGIPLIRYNLHDRVYLYSWSKIQKEVKKFPFTSPLEKELAAMILRATSWLPDLIAIFGRSDSSINLGGTKIYEFQLDASVRSAELSDYLTGIYQAKLAFIEDHSYIDILVETKPQIKNDPETSSKIEVLLDQKLKEFNIEYKSNCEHIYDPRFKAIGLGALKLRMIPFPSLSSAIENTIKLRGITPEEPGTG